MSNESTWKIKVSDESLELKALKNLSTYIEPDQAWEVYNVFVKSYFKKHSTQLYSSKNQKVYYHNRALVFDRFVELYFNRVPRGHERYD